MYSRSEILEAVHNPHIIQRAVTRRILRYIYDPLINSYTYHKKKNHSKFGLVINWGFHRLNRWPVAHYPFLVDEIIDEFDPVLITSQRKYNQNKSNLDYIFAFDPGSHHCPRIQYDTTEDHTVGVLVGHTHDKKEWFDSYVYENQIDYVFSTYYNPFLNHFPEFDRERLIHFPWSIPEKFIIPRDCINYHDQDSLNMFGSSGHKMYRTRDRIRELPYVKIHPYAHDSKDTLGPEDYYTWLRNFDTMIAAGSLKPDLQYTFAKYFEIPAAGCLLFAQYCEDLDKLGFDDGNSVIFHNIEELEEKKDRYFKNPEEYMDIRKSGVDLIRERHTITNRIKKIRTHLED